MGFSWFAPDRLHALSVPRPHKPTPQSCVERLVQGGPRHDPVVNDELFLEAGSGTMIMAARFKESKPKTGVGDESLGHQASSPVSASP